MATKPKLVPSPVIVHTQVPSNHIFDVILTGDFEHDHFRLSAADSVQAKQYAIDEYFRRSGVLPSSVDKIVQIN